MQRKSGHCRAVAQRITGAPTAGMGSAGRAVLSIAVLVLTLGVAPSALAAPGHVLGGSFGAFSDPAGVAASQMTGDVFVADQNNGLVQRFAADGTFLSNFDGSGTPDGSMLPSAIAIDESSVTPSIYVADANRPVVNKFTLDGTYISQIQVSPDPQAQVFGLAIDPTNGDVYVSSFAAGGVVVYDSAGVLQSIITGEGTQGQLGVSGAVAVNGAGNVYIADSAFTGSAVVKLFSTDGSYVSTVYPDAAGGSIAVDPVSGDLFVLDSALGSPRVIQFDSAGVRQFVFGTNQIGFPAGSSWPTVPGLGVDHASGRVYVADQSADQIVYFDAVTLPDVITSSPSNETPIGATISGSIDPLGIDTIYRFDYGLTQDYGLTTPESSAGSGTGPVPVDAALSDLQPNQLYHYRLIGTNEFGSNQGEDQTLTTTAVPPSVDGQTPFASNVRAINARLNGTVNPNNLPTTYHFEYGMTEEALDSSTPPQNAGSGFGDVSASQLISDLAPDTTYFFRIVADNGTDGPATGATGAFTTSPATATATVQPVTDITTTSARLHGTVDSHAPAGTARFSIEGVDSAYSSVTPETDLESGAGAQPISALISDLPAGRRFRVRTIAKTAGGTVQSDAVEFATLQGPVTRQPTTGENPQPYGCASPRLTSYRGQARVGRSITVLGTDLGVSGVFRLGSKVADTSSWNSTSIRVQIPKGLKGRVQLRVTCTNLSNSLTVRVVAPNKAKRCKKGTTRKTVRRGNKRVTKCVATRKKRRPRA